MATPKRGTKRKTSKQAAPDDGSTPEAPATRTEEMRTVLAKRSKAPRTAGGKRGNPEQLAAAQAQATDWLRERTEEGHRAAGRTPPSQRNAPRASMPARRIDDDLRDFIGPVTEDEKLLQYPGQRGDGFTRTDPWRVMRIMGEFIEGFDELASIEKGVSVFGSARTPPTTRSTRPRSRPRACSPRPASRSSPAPAPASWRRRTRARGSAAAARSAATSSCRSSRAPIRTSIRW